MRKICAGYKSIKIHENLRDLVEKLCCYGKPRLDDEEPGTKNRANEADVRVIFDIATSSCSRIYSDSSCHRNGANPHIIKQSLSTEHTSDLSQMKMHVIKLRDL